MAGEPARSANATPVVLVPGLWMPPMVMWPLGRRLRRRGFPTQRFGYHSLSAGLEANARLLAAFVAREERVHLVGHSLGGLVILTALALGVSSARRVVLMGSPTNGCHSASFALRSPVLRGLVGRSLRDWLDARPDIPATADIGVLSGSVPLGVGRLLPGLPRPNDGVVACAETRLPQARDSIDLRVTHTQMLLSARCADQVANFLRYGTFVHD